MCISAHEGEHDDTLTEIASVIESRRGDVELKVKDNDVGDKYKLIEGYVDISHQGVFLKQSLSGEEQEDCKNAAETETRNPNDRMECEFGYVSCPFLGVGEAMKNQQRYQWDERDRCQLQGTRR